MNAKTDRQKEKMFVLPCNCGNSYIRSGTRFCAMNDVKCPVLYGKKRDKCFLEKAGPIKR